MVVDDDADPAHHPVGRAHLGTVVADERVGHEARGLAVHGGGVGDHHLEMGAVAVDRESQGLPVHKRRVGYQDSQKLPLTCGETSAGKEHRRRSTRLAWAAAWAAASKVVYT